MYIISTSLASECEGYVETFTNCNRLKLQAVDGKCISQVLFLLVDNIAFPLCAAICNLIANIFAGNSEECYGAFYYFVFVYFMVEQLADIS